MKFKFGIFICVLFVAWGVTNAESVHFHTHVSLISEKQVIAPGESWDVGVLLEMEPGWHTYWKDPGDSGLATSVQWKLPQGFTAGPIRWPKPLAIKAAGLTSYGYENEVLLPVRIQAPQNDNYKDQKLHLEARVDWLECKDICIPGSSVVSTTLQIGAQSQDSLSHIVALFKKYRLLIPSEKENSTSSQNIHGQTIQSLWKMLFAAFLGGMILNLMPCVLPVIAIKILSFVKQSGDEPQRVRWLGLMFTAGVLVSFWILALLLVVLRFTGNEIGWGFQFQDPHFVGLMALVMTGVALNFFGVFEWRTSSRTIHAAGNLAMRQGGVGAFLNGVLATMLATPCTAPFLAPAVGFALSQTSFVIFIIFTFIGLGLALPYMIFSLDPRLLKWLPKPGPWMLYFKQAMGFPMLATVLWLLWILSSSYGHTIAISVAGWLLAVSFAIWLGSVLISESFIWIGFVLILGATAIYHRVSYDIIHSKESSLKSIGSGIEWQPYSKSSLESALQTTHPVFVDFTADWCLTCQVNKRTSLDVSAVVQKMKELHVMTFLADWTKSNHEIAEILRSFNRSGVPLYVLYPVDRTRQPILLPEVLTPRIVLDALEESVKVNP